MIGSIFLEGTFPFQSAELLQGDQATHRLNHDLEALFWVVWIICVNVNGPFNNRRQWQRPVPLKSRSMVSMAKLATYETTRRPVENDPWARQVHVPQWARPGIHNLDAASVAAGKTDIGSAGIAAALSPYFSKHKAVVQGLIKLHELFQWRAAGSRDSDTDLGSRTVVLPPPDTDYLKVMGILRDIRDNIDPAMDGRPSPEVYKEARERYDRLLNSGNICEPLLDGSRSSARTPRGTSNSQCSVRSERSAKRPAEGSGDRGSTKRSIQGGSSHTSRNSSAR